MNRKRIKLVLLCGMLGCILMGTGDWLMLYGDPTATGAAFWLTEGAAQIPAWRNVLSMAVAFPATVFYGVGLFGIGAFLQGENERKIWFILTAFGLTPWLCIHLFVVGTLYLFSWLRGSAWAAAAMPAAEALRSQFGWLVWISYPFMLPPYFYWAWQVFRGRSIFPKWMAFSNLFFPCTIGTTSFGTPHFSLVSSHFSYFTTPFADIFSLNNPLANLRKSSPH